MNNTYIQKLTELKNKLKNHKMSALIGAGFSKNVSPNLFMNWSQLLKDMVLELYGSEINEAYDKKYTPFSTGKNKKNRKLFGVEKAEFYKTKIEEVLTREGYLEVVSEFIRRRGYKEAITTYIEERIPYVVWNEDGLPSHLALNDEKEELTNDKLTLHRKLIQLPWNNIYTTNYDQLLDIVIDNKLEDKINTEIKDIETELHKDYTNLDDLEIDIKKLDGQILEIKEKIKIHTETEIATSSPTLSSSISSSTRLKEELIKELDNLSKQRVSKTNHKNDVLSIIKDKEGNRRLMIKRRDDNFKVVKKSSQLAVKRNRNIIKLHGSLRSDNCKFGFDDDIHKHYVIAKEDYLSYPQKHEAFTQLMRISLLQESFCLIGFSGIDPNFISWINWVRDILTRKQENESDEYKIYLIDTDPSDLAADKKLFYENHRIFRIPISDKSIIEYLLEEAGEYKSKKIDTREAIHLLLKYLADEYYINEAEAALEAKKQNDYRVVWEKLNIYNSNSFSPNAVLSLVEELWLLKLENRLPSIHFVHSHQKQTILSYAITFLNKVKNDTPSKINAFLKLLIIAIKDSFLPVTWLWEKSDLTILVKEFSKHDELNTLFNLLLLRNDTLQNDLNITSDQEVVIRRIPFLQNLLGEIGKVEVRTIEDKNILQYEKVLAIAFSLDFDKLKEELLIWDTNSHWNLKRVGLLCLFDDQKEYSQQILVNYSEQLSTANYQEQLYTFELLKYIKQNISWGREKELTLIIDRIKNLGFKKTNENFNYLIEGVIGQDKNIIPFGEGRFSISNSVSFSRTNAREQSIQFLQLLIETGFPLSLSNVHYYEYKKWYYVHKQIFEFYPYPTLFYSLQYSNEKFLKRIGQEYAHSDDLKNDIANICNSLLTSYLLNYTPQDYKRSILFFTSELFIAVQPEVWQDKFYTIWLQLIAEGKAFFRERVFEDYNFIVKALPYIQNINILYKILTDILENIERAFNTGIGYLYYINQNKNLKLLKKVFYYNQLKLKIDSLIDNIPNKKEDSLFVLSNLYRIISATQKNEILSKLLQTNLSEIKNERIWPNILFFSKRNKKLKASIKTSIIENKNLWYTGVDGDKVHGGLHDFIKIHELRISQLRPEGITWTTDEVKLIYDKLKLAFQDIKRICEKYNDLFTSFLGILQEMLYFLNDEESQLSKEEDYEELKQQVQVLYNKERGYNTIFHGILSSDKSEVVWALNELSALLYKGFTQNMQQELSSLLNKVLLQAEPSLEASLDYLASWFTDKKDDQEFKKYAFILNEILLKYSVSELNEYDKPFVYKRLIKIAKVLKYWEVQGNHIEKWLEEEQHSRFNNIRYF